MSRKALFFWLIFIPDIILLYASLYLAIFLRYKGALEISSVNTHLKVFSLLFVF